MKIELKRIEFSERMSEETNCFTADLYIDGKKIGEASNTGKGEANSYCPYEKEGRELIRKAEKFCETMPPEKAEFNGEPFEFKMNLERYIDVLLNRHLAAMELKKFNAKIKKATGNGIVYGIPDDSFKVLSFKKSIDEIVSFKIWKEQLIENIKSTIKPRLVDGVVIFNTNIPEDIFKAAGLKVSQYVKPEASLKGKQKQERTRGKKV
jgi:hypothetical protein